MEYWQVFCLARWRQVCVCQTDRSDLIPFLPSSEQFSHTGRALGPLNLRDKTLENILHFLI